MEIFEAIAEDKDVERRQTSLGFFKTKELAYKALTEFIEENKTNKRVCFENLTVQIHTLIGD